MQLYKEKKQEWAPNLGPEQVTGSTLGGVIWAGAQEFSSGRVRPWDVQGGGQADVFGGQQVGRGWKNKFESCQYKIDH